jgi:myo-inositol-1(or 4)-monophosphatase
MPNVSIDTMKKISDVVIAAANKLMGMEDEYRRVLSSKGHDIKIMGDSLIENFIIEGLRRIAHFDVLAEESSNGDICLSSGYYWIVDPIDGSLNYSRNIPLFCISVALFKDGKPLIGVIYDPSRSEIFSGMVGVGSWLNDEPIFVSKTLAKNNAIICTGFPSHTDFETKSLTSFVKEVQEYKKVRLFGTAALSIAYVACGRADI